MGYDLINELMQKTTLLDNSLKQLRINGSAFAEAEKNYKIAVNKKALQLRTEGMAVTLIQTIIYGYDDIATLRFLRDTAEVTYKANLEALNVLKLQIRVLEASINREWNNTK